MFKLKKFFFTKKLKTLLRFETQPDSAWKKLNNHTPVIYKDNPREDVYPLLKFKPQRVLDIGCYCGAVGANLKKSYGNNVYICGIEVNDEAATIARKRLDKVTTQTLETWNEEELALLSEIDTVFLLDVLEHIYNPWLILEILRKHLPQHAQIIISLPNIMHLGVISDLVNGYWHYTDAGLLDVTHIRFFTPFEMRLLFKQTGFLIEQEKFNVPKMKEKYFPFILSSDNFTLKIKNQEQWNNLNAMQIYFQLIINKDFYSTDEILSHPPTLANQGK